MAKKTIVLILFLFVGTFYIKAQNCGTIEKNTKEKGRLYFVDYESYTITSMDSLLQMINFTDTALVKMIILNGEKSEFYEAFFLNKKVPIKRISFSDFSVLQFDSLILNRREKRHEAKYEKIKKKNFDLIMNDKSNKTISKKLGKAKYMALERKRTSIIPLLFKMYPIYTYGKYTLIMYSIFYNKHGIPFIYEICKSQ